MGLVALATEGPAGNSIVSGALAGAVSVIVFLIVHQLMISDIWWSAVLMLGAGAACGAALAGTFGMVARPTTMGWIGYNALWVALLGGLGVASILVFEPVTTVAQLIEADGPPDELIGQALPMTAAFTVFAAVVVTRLAIGRWSALPAVLGTTVLVVLLLGLNISVIGLAEFESREGVLVAELFALVLVLAAVYAAVYWLLERRRLVDSAV